MSIFVLGFGRWGTVTQNRKLKEYMYMGTVIQSHNLKMLQKSYSAEESNIFIPYYNYLKIHFHIKIHIFKSKCFITNSPKSIRSIGNCPYLFYLFYFLFIVSKSLLSILIWIKNLHDVIMLMKSWVEG